MANFTQEEIENSLTVWCTKVSVDGAFTHRDIRLEHPSYQPIELIALAADLAEGSTAAQTKAWIVAEGQTRVAVAKPPVVTRAEEVDTVVLVKDLS